MFKHPDRKKPLAVKKQPPKNVVPKPVVQAPQELKKLPELPAKLLTPHEKQRKQIRDAAGAYRSLLLSAGDLLELFALDRRLDIPTLNRLVEDCFDFFWDVNGTLLFENVQLARYDLSYHKYHLVNVALLNMTLGRTISMDKDWLIHIARIGLLADIGMMLLPLRILDGKEPLGEQDFERIKGHSLASVRVLQMSGILDESIWSAVRHHHERFNGGGYPDKLAGADIPIEARITSVTDSFDAALARKYYKDLKSPFAVLHEFARDESGTLDPELTNTLVELISGMLLGRHALLSDGSVGRVAFVDPDNLAFPEMRVLGKTVQTGPLLYPLSLTGHMSLH